MTSPIREDKVLRTELVRWGVFMVGGLIMAGAMSMANRNVYDKEQVDEKLAAIARDRAYELRIVNTKLDNIYSALREIKAEVKKQ